MATAAGDVLRLVRKGIGVKAVRAHTRRPFRFYLCGDPALVAALRTTMLSGHNDDTVPLDAAACLETITPGFASTDAREARLAIFLGRRGDAAHADLRTLAVLRVPILAVTVDEQAAPSGPAGPPARSEPAYYNVPALSRDALRGRVFPHMIECCKGVEIAVGRRLPALRETVAAKLTRDAARSAVKVALASAAVDHIPLVGIVLGAFASAGDMVAITATQMMLSLHIEAVYGRDPDVQHIWQLLPVVGGGFGWRMLARELSGFIPVAGIAIKGAIAYAGTIVVGEGVTFFMEHGRHMSPHQASAIYDSTKNEALTFARELAGKLERAGYISTYVLKSHTRMCAGLLIDLLAPLFPQHAPKWPPRLIEPARPFLSLKDRQINLYSRIPVFHWALQCMEGVRRSFDRHYPPRSFTAV